MNEPFALTGARVLLDGRFCDGVSVVVASGRIHQILKDSGLPSDLEKLDLNGCYLIPGMIDLQVNGAAGCMMNVNPTLEGLKDMELQLLREGTTGFLAAVPTSSDRMCRKVFRLLHAYRKSALGNLLGLHMEGPYLNPQSKGAHKARLIRKATMDHARWMCQASEGQMRLMTLAPELQDPEILDYLENQNVSLSLGHSAASYLQARDFLLGALKRPRSVTHLFNAMPSIGHRGEVGPIPAIMELIPFSSVVADGHHVAWSVLRLAWKSLGSSLTLVTDRQTVTQGVDCPYYDAGDYFALRGSDGKGKTLSGAKLTMLEAVRNLHEKVGVPLEQAVKAATLNPARILCMEQRVGRIAPGLDADLVAFDSGFHIRKVFFKGVETALSES